MAVRRLAEQQPEGFTFSAENMRWAETMISRFPAGRQASAVIPLLWRAQEQEGWVSQPMIEGVAGILDMPTIRVLEIATFYTMFQLEPVGRKAHVQVCGTTPCMLRGAGEIIDICRARIHEHPHHLSPDGDFSWEEVECLGACVNAPMVQIFKDTYEDLSKDSFNAVLDAFARGDRPEPGPQNGRHASVPITGLTSLTEIDYADDAVTGRMAPRGTGAAEASIPDQEGAGVAPGEPTTTMSEVSGGEQFTSEQQRRSGIGVADLPTETPQAANQNIGRVDATGRSDEAAAGSMAQGAPGAAAGQPASAETAAGVRKDAPREGGDKDAQPRSDRDSARGDKET